jgi:hypothetical protein
VKISAGHRPRTVGSIVLLLLPTVSCGLKEITHGNSGSRLPDAGAISDPIQIQGQTIPPDKVVAFIHIGHSNMAGRATVPEALKPYFYAPDPRLWSFHWQDPTSGSGLPFIWTPAIEPLSPDKETAGRAGPGMALLRAAQAMSHPDMTFVSIGHGRSGSLGGQCVAFRRDGLAYRVAMGPAVALRGKVTWGGIFVMLGASEADLAGRDDHLQFGACLAGIAAEMREDLGDPNIPFLIGDWEEGASGPFGPTGPTAQAIVPQLRMTPLNVARSVVIPADMLPMQDDHHFNMEGHKGWADRGMRLLKDHGWAPWAMP